MADYVNNREQWPDGLWEECGDPPADDQRCQFEVAADQRCGLPAYADSESGEPRCIFHYKGEDRDPWELRFALEAAVAKGADLWDANLHEASLFRANLREANLEYANLQEANLTFANLQRADLRIAHLVGAVDLRGADLTNARLERFELSPEAKLDNVNWGLAPSKMLRDEREARSPGPHEDVTFAECEAVYRQIKLSYQNSGDYQQAGQFFIREMECKRAQLCLKGFLPRFWERRFWRMFFRRGWWKPRPMWNWLSRGATRALWCVSYYICQHGENPARLAGVMGLVIVLFAFIHSLVGVDGSAGESIIMSGFAMPPLAELPRQMMKALYFSAVTFTSLGYGDMRPVGALGQLVSVMEVSLGIILVALFVGCVIRKLSR